MRRANREVTSIKEILKIVNKCDVCRLALSNANNVPYIVPLNFGYEYAPGKLTLYFHGAGEGKKMDMIRQNPIVGFEMDCSHKLIEGENACNYTMEYESVIGSGKITICTENDEKRHALLCIMRAYAPGREFTFSSGALAAVSVFKLEADEFTCKRFKKN